MFYQQCVYLYVKKKKERKFLFYSEERKTQFFKTIYFGSGYDQVPVNSMQGLDLGGPGAAGGYSGHMDNLPDLGPASDLNFDSIDPNMSGAHGDGAPAMWFDTDL